MASPSKIVFKVTGSTVNTSSGLSFQFEGTTYNFNAANKVVPLGRFRSSTSTNTSANNIASAIISFFNQRGSIITAESNGAFVNISVTDPDSTSNFTTGSGGGNVQFVEIIDADTDGTGAEGDNAVDILSVTHQTTNFYSTEAKGFLYGNFCDVVTTIIEFETLNAITYVNFKGATIENSIEVYSQSSDSFEIDSELFRSSVTNDLMRYTGTFGTLSLNNPKSGLDGSVTFTNLGSNQYRLTHVHIMQRVLRTEDLNGNFIQTPEVYDGQNSLKYIFEIEGRSDLINPEPEFSTADVDLSEFIGIGNVGFNNEFLNGNDPFYTLVDTFVFDTGNDEIDRNQDSTATFQISSTNGNFTTSTDLELYIQEISDNFETLQTLQENLNIDRVLFVADGTPVSGTSVLNATATVNGGDPTLIDVSFQIGTNTIDGQYFVKIAVSNDNSNINHNNIPLQVGIAGLVADETTINFDTYPDAPRTDYNFNTHYNNDIINSYNEIVGCIEDRYLARFRVVNSAVLPVTNTLVDFEIQLKNRLTGEVFTSFIFTADNLPIDSTRNFKLSDTDFKNLVQVTETSTGVYDFVYGFQLWSGWIDQANLVFSTLCTFDQLTNTGEIIRFTKEFQSPDFIMWNYDTTINTLLEPQVLRSPESIQMYDNDTNTEVKGIVKNRDTRVYATFQDDNLDDLQVSSAAELVGYLGINDLSTNQFTYEMFHSLIANDADRPWQQIDLEPDFNALITLISVKKCSIEAVLNWSKFKALFPSQEEFQISARMDKLIVQASSFSIFTDIDSSIDTFNIFTYSPLPVTYLFENGSSIVGTPPLNSISTTGNGLNGTVQEVQISSDDLSSITDLILIEADIINNVDLTKLTGLTNLTIRDMNISGVLFADNIPLENLSLKENTGTMTSLDISNTSPNNLDLEVIGDQAGTYTKLNSLLMPNDGSTIINLEINDNNLGAFDFSGHVMNGTLVAQRAGFTSINLADGLYTGVTLQNNTLLTTLDFSGNKTIEASTFRVDFCALTSLIQPDNTSFVSNRFWFNDNDITTLDVSNFTDGLGVNIAGQRNDLSSITLPSTTVYTVNTFTLSNQSSSLTTLDLSMLDLGGSVSVQANSSLNTLTLGTQPNGLTSLEATFCDLTPIDFSNVGNSDGITIQLQSNTMTSAEVNEQLVILDNTGWIDGILNITFGNSAIDSASGGFNGTAAASNLTGKGWFIL